MKISVRYKLFIFAFTVLGINMALGFAVYKSDRKLLDSEKWVQHSQQVIIQSSNIRSLAREMQITSRDFLITDDSVFLEPLNHTQKAAFSYIGLLKQLTRDNPTQQMLTDSLNLYIHKLANYSSKTIELREKQGLSSVIAYTTDKQRKHYTNRINQISNTIQEREDVLFKQRKQINARNEIAFSRFSLAIFILMAGFTILLVIVAGKYLYQTKEKRKQAAELLIANDELLFQNREKGNRAAELLIANKELLFQNEEKEKRAEELLIANKELLFQNEEKEKRALELTKANMELVFQNDEKGKRAAELKLAEIERIKMVDELLQRNKELEQFAYIVSHNLRAPVANILGASNALNDIGLSTKEKVILNKGIHTSVIKIDDIIHDLNHILQVKGKVNEVKEIVVFSGLVDDIKASISYLIAKDDIEIKYDFPDVDEYFTVKPYLYSIFLNLISNSVKYRQPDKACTIEIMSHRLKNKIELIFSDNGMGIDLEKKGGQVFGLYKRFHENIEGKGLGLFMVKTQVETLGGKISVKSEQNVGTEFKIEFEI